MAIYIAALEAPSSENQAPIKYVASVFATSKVRGEGHDHVTSLMRLEISALVKVAIGTAFCRL